jgi:hypothetical protein
MSSRSVGHEDPAKGSTCSRILAMNLCLRTGDTRGLENRNVEWRHHAIE